MLVVNRKGLGMEVETVTALHRVVSVGVMEAIREKDLTKRRSEPTKLYKGEVCSGELRISLSLKTDCKN